MGTVETNVGHSEPLNDDLLIGGYAENHPEIVAGLRPLIAIDTLAAFAGLLTVPDLQANCLRIELMVHLAAAYCRGRVPLAPGFSKLVFDKLGEGRCGTAEDPAENVFTVLVNTPNGNFRVFEGLNEGASFYLQRVLNVLTTMPNQEPFDLLLRSVYSLLRLSEDVAARAQVDENQLGREIPLETLPDGISREVPSLAGRVMFDLADLERLGVSQEALSPFVFDPASGEDLLTQEVGNSELERYPLACWDGGVCLLVPTAVTAAIRRFVIEAMPVLEATKAFEEILAHETGWLLHDTPILGKLSGLETRFARVGNCRVGHQLTEIDAGRFLQFVVVVEGLEAFSDRGLNGVHRFTPELTEALQGAINAAHHEVKGHANYRDGMTVVVSAGVGRGFDLSLPAPLPDGWRLKGMPLHDLVTLSSLINFTPLTLWRIDDAEMALRELGVFLVNYSGEINLVGAARAFNGHLLPPQAFPVQTTRPPAPTVILVPSNLHLQLRRDVLEHWNPRRILDIDGRWRTVRKFGPSGFKEDNYGLTYFSEKDLASGRLLGVRLTTVRPWWIQVEAPEHASTRTAFEYWRSLAMWLNRAVEPLEAAYPQLRGGPILLVVVFAEINASSGAHVFPKHQEELSALIEVSASHGSSSITIRIGLGFEDGFLQAENVAERALVESMITGVAVCAGAPHDAVALETVLNDICPRGDARMIHRLKARRFRDFIRPQLSEAPILSDPIDHATLLIGLGQKLGLWQVPSDVIGKANCIAVLNRAVEVLIAEIVSELKNLNRRSFINTVVHNYETAACHRDHWRQTSRALIATHGDRDSAKQTIVEQNGRFNACSVASRVLLEAALCECPLDSGRQPGHLEIARMMTKVMIVFQFGGWSDAVRWDAMEPHLRLTALGDIQANVTFMETIYEPFGRSGGGALVEQAVADYDHLFDSIEPSVSAALQPDAAFLSAWETEFGVPLGGFRSFVQQLETVALDGARPSFELPRSKLVAMLSEAAAVTPENAKESLSFITSMPRPAWPIVPADYMPSDWYPWRYRRRLAILRRPFIQLDETDDPLIVCVPGMIGDAFRSMLEWYRKGEIPIARTRQMGSWLGRVNNLQRSEFNEIVAGELRRRGWQAKKEVNVTHILGRSFDLNYGDVDVLAWRTGPNRILAIECKDLQAHTTISEVAGQLNDFRGETRADGKRDHLKRHLDRLAVLSANSDTVARFLGFVSPVSIEGHLVFKNLVPMRFAWDHMATQIKLSLFSELDCI